MRNGVIADALRRGGSPFKIIFGVNMPQLAEIAAGEGPDIELARELWDNRSTRESMLLAPMLVDAATFTPDEARRWIASVPSPEIADNLVHKLLRHMNCGYELAVEASRSDNDMQHYVAMRLLWHYLRVHPEEVRALAEAEITRDCALTRQAAVQIVDELDFISGKG